MILESWRIQSERIQRRWWQVVVHDSQASMTRVGRRLNPWHPAAFWQGTYWGLCQPVQSRVRVYPDGSEGPEVWPSNGYSGVVHLLSEKLYPEIIYHEIAHAAMATYRMVSPNPADFQDNEDMIREEDFAYILGQLASDMDTAIRGRSA